MMVVRNGRCFGFGWYFFWCGRDGEVGRLWSGTMSVLPNPPSPRVVDVGRVVTVVRVGKSQWEKTNCAMLEDLGMRTGELELLCIITLTSPR